MPEITNVNRRPRLWLTMLFLFALACGDLGGGGCDGLGGGCDGGCDMTSCDSCDSCGGDCGGDMEIDLDAPYPGVGSIIDQAVQIRLSTHGITFIEENAGAIIGNALGEEGLSFCLETQEIDLLGLTYEICGGDDMICDDGVTAGCQLTPEVDSVAITPVDADPESDRLDVTAFLNLDEVISLGLCPGLLVRGERVPIDIKVHFNVDHEEVRSTLDPIPGASHRTWIELTDLTSTFAGLSFEPVNTGLDTCGLLALTLNGSLPLIGPPIVETIAGDLLDTILCTGCDAGCGEGGYCPDESTICYYIENREQCVPIWLGVEGAIDVTSLLADYAPGFENLLNFIAYAGNYADAEEDGLSLAAFGGLYSPHDDCVPDLPEPSTDTVAKSTDLLTDLTPFGGTFHLGIGIAQRFLNHALWTAYRSGALCIAIGTETVDQLSSSTLGIFLTSLPILTEGMNAPMILRLVPDEPPWLELGTGEVTPGDPPVVVDPLMIAHVDNLKIDFYVFMEERFARIFTLDTDVAVPLAITGADDGSGIQILLGDLTEAFTRVEPINAELLAEEDVANLAEVLPGLVGALVPTLAASLEDPIEIPEFAGLKLVIEQGSFTSIEDGTMLAVFAKLAIAEGDGSTGIVQLPQAVANVEAINGPTPADIEAFEDRRLRGDPLDLDDLRTELVLTVDTLYAGPGDREYSYRMDGGMWHIYQAGPTMTIRDPSLFVEGEHTVEVRSRVPGVANTLSLVSDPIRTTIDLSRPDLQLTRVTEALIQVESYDTLWPVYELSARYRFDDGPWMDVNPSGLIVLPLEDRRVELSVEVEDPSGNSRLITRRLALHGPSSVAEDAPTGCGCSAAPVGGAGASAVWLLGLAGLVLLRRRRRPQARLNERHYGRLLVLAILCLFMAALAACNDDPGTTAPEPETCGDGCEGDQICVNDRCVDNVCAEDDECPDGMVCVGDRCVIRTICTDNSDCLEGQFCIDDDDDGGSECMAMPCTENSDCAALSCGGGRIAYCVDESCFCEFPCADGCGEEEYCCHATNTCETVPNVCGAMECEVGFGPAVVTPAEGDPDSCEISGPDCECQELPPLPIGDVGVHLSAAAGPDGTIYVAAFNRTYDDLMVGQVLDDLSIEWWFVDGVPETGTVAGSLNGPRGGITDGGRSVGRYTGIGVDGDGNLHVAYYNETDKRLDYARGTSNGSGFDWTFSIVDDADRAGRYISMTMSADGIPAITYFVGRVEIETGVWHSQVRQAWADANEPTAFTIENVSSVASLLPCGGPCFGSQRCHEAVNRCETATRAAFCEPECGEGQACFESDEGTVCGTAYSFGPTLAGLPDGSGLMVDARRFSTGEVGVAWYDHDRGNLMYSASVGGTFADAVPQLIDGEVPDGDDEDSAPDDTGDVGVFPSIGIGPDDSVHFTYVDSTNYKLLYSTLGGAGSEVVDTGMGGAQPSLIGDDSTIYVNDDGSLTVSYQNATNHWALVRRRFGETGWIVPDIVMGDEDPYDGSFGFYLTQLKVDGTVYVISYRINSRAGVRDVVVRVFE